jgi:hypothetical protein
MLVLIADINSFVAGIQPSLIVPDYYYPYCVFASHAVPKTENSCVGALGCNMRSVFN